MIRIFDGVPGSGKSYHAAEDILAKLCAGCHVVTNLPLHWDALARIAALPTVGLFSTKPGVILEREQLTILTEEQTKDFFSYLPEGTLDCPTEGYFDELQNLFNSRNWAETQKKHGHVLKFVSHHRHYHTNLTLLTQDRGNIDKQFRVMCAEYWEHIDLNGWSLLGIGWPLPQFFRKKYSGADEKHRLKAAFVWKDRRIWTCYDSHNKVQGIELSRKVCRLKLVAAKVSRFHKFTAMIKSWAIIAVIVLAGFVYLWGKLAPAHPAKPGAAPPASFLQQPARVVASALPGIGPGGSPALAAPASTPHDEVVTEHLRYSEGTYHRRTDKGAYTLGRMCAHGRVVAVDDDLVTCRRLDGSGTVYVILDGSMYSGGSASVLPVVPVQQTAAAPVAPVAPAVAPISAPAHEPQTFSEREGARISASLRAPMAATPAPIVNQPGGQAPRYPGYAGGPGPATVGGTIR